MLLASVAVCMVLACASASGAARPRRDPNLITAEEIAEMRQAGVRDLYELIDRQRPAWLRRRNERSFNLENTIRVYHNETPLGGVDVLRGYPLMSVVTLRFLDPSQAGLLPGGGSSHVDGAIVIQTGTQVPDTLPARSPPS